MQLLGIVLGTPDHARLVRPIGGRRRIGDISITYRAYSTSSRATWRRDSMRTKPAGNSEACGIPGSGWRCRSIDERLCTEWRTLRTRPHKVHQLMRCLWIDAACSRIVGCEADG